MDADLAIVAPSGLADELRRLYCALVDDALAALAGGGGQSDDSDHVRARERREAFEWFLSDATDYGTAFVVIAEALDLNIDAVRAEVRRRWEQVTMGEPATKTFTCERCSASFDHTYPLGFGKACRFCPACKASPAKSKPAPSTALVPAKPATALPAVRPARNGGGPRPAPKVAKPATAITLPAPTARAVTALVAELTAERDELDATIRYLTRRYAVDAEA